MDNLAFKKLLNFLIIFVIITSCSSNDSSEQQQNEFPTNIEIASQSAEIGEIITINGNGFLPNETYTVTFTQNKIAEIIEISSNYLSVEVPENAISGLITLTFNNQTEPIGTIEIVNEPTKLIAFKELENSTTSPIDVIEFDFSTNQENQISQISNTAPIRSTAYFENEDQVFAVTGSENQIGEYTSKLVNYNLTTQNSQTYDLDNSSYYMLISVSNQLLALKTPENQSSQTELIELNKSNGQETILSQIGILNPIRNISYDSSTNSLFAISNTENQNGDFVNQLVKVNLSDYSTNSFTLEESKSYFVFSINSGLFGFKAPENLIGTTELIEFNKNTGTENTLENLDNLFPIRNIFHKNNQNKIYAISDRENQNGDVETKLLILNLNDFNLETTQLDNTFFYTIAKIE